MEPARNGWVTGIGQCSWDCLALVAEWPEPDDKEEVLAWEEQGGGPVATALVTLARSGVRCRFHGVVGDDPTGEFGSLWKVLPTPDILDDHPDVRHATEGMLGKGPHRPAGRRRGGLCAADLGRRGAGRHGRGRSRRLRRVDRPGPAVG